MTFTPKPAPARTSPLRACVIPATRAARPKIIETLESRVLLATTSDTSFGTQYALSNTATAKAWDLTRGSATVLIGHLDTGVDYRHADLYSNIWINQSEIPRTVRPTLKDTDRDGRISFYDLNDPLNKPRMTDVNRNGYIDAGDLLNPTGRGGWEDKVNGRNNANDVYTDDIIGWDFAEDDNKPFDDGSENGGHGTHTAGIIAATGNNGRGISGVIQKASLMVLRLFDDHGFGADDAQLARAIRYSADSGAKVANASWGGGYGYNGDPIYQAIKYAGSKGQTFVTAAGNDGENLDGHYDDFPSEYDLGNILVVAATTSSRTLASFSNFGRTRADIAAPGSGVMSTLPNNRYGRMSGTSMAAPMVTGTVALMLARNKAITLSDIRSRLLNGADKRSALDNRTVSDGELNVNNALRNLKGTALV
ncbi:MAG TPA: S8 family peptidase [Tepidisphaeraceae bacterium]|nr:S8 family peptidase [Tepidisphaeraceae bacterium]